MPILVLTAAEDDELQQEMYQSGATGFLRRPIDESLLVQRIKNLVDIRQANDPRSYRERLMQEREKFVALLGGIVTVRTHRPDELKKRSDLARLIAVRQSLDSNTVWRAAMAAYLCDLGKIGLPAGIRDTNDVGALAPADRIIFQSHIVIGYELLVNSNRYQPWRAKRRLVDPSSREAALFSRRALRQRENKVGL